MVRSAPSRVSEPVKETDLILRSVAKRCVSKDGHNTRTRSHPSRRAQGRAPRDEVGDIFTPSQGEDLSFRVAGLPCRFKRVRRLPSLPRKARKPLAKKKRQRESYN